MAKKHHKKASQSGRKPTQSDQERCNEAVTLLDELESQLKAMAGPLPPDVQRAVDVARESAHAGDLAAFDELLTKIISLPQTFDSQDAEREMLPLGMSDSGKASIRLTSPAGCAVIRASGEDHQDMNEEELHAVLKVDPDSVETLVWLGAHAENASEQLQWFTRAIEAASRHRPEDAAKAMPSLRREMLENLRAKGQLSDAATLAAPGLAEDPSDETGLRFLLTDLYLQLGWHDELHELIGQYINDDIGVIAFARALLAFREHGVGELANGYLNDAHAKYPGIAEFLCGVNPMSSIDEAMTRGVSFAEARADLLIRAWKDTEGAAAWGRRTLADEMIVHTEDSRAPTADKFSGDLPWLNYRIDALGDALDLDTSEGEWRMIVQKNEASSTAHTLAIMDDGMLVYARPFDDKPTTRELRDSMLRSIADPIIGAPRKPRCILVGSKAHYNAISKMCSTINVDCRVEKLSTQDQRTSKEVMGHLASDLQRMTQSSYDDGSDDRMTSDPEQPEEWFEEFAAEVSRIPVGDEDWLLAVVRPPLYVTDGPVPERPWLTVLLDSERGLIVNLDAREREPSIFDTLEFVHSTMRRPKHGPSRRPCGIIVAPDFLRESSPNWSSILAATEARIEGDDGEDDVQTLAEYVVAGPPGVDDIFTAVISEMLEVNGPTQSQLRKLKGIDDSFLKEFFHRVAVLYRAKPWKLVQADRPFFVTCQDWEQSTWACFIMGQLGQQLGLNLFDNPDDARAIATHRDTSRYLNAAVIQYDEAHGAAPADVWSIERMGWEVASEQAYPFVVRMKDGKRFIPVTSEDLRVLNDILPHIPRFLDHPDDQPFDVTESGKQIQFGWK